MDGQYLNNFVAWIENAINSSDAIVGDDLDWFIQPIPKSHWLLVGFSLWTFAKKTIKDNNLDYLVELLITLETTKNPNREPMHLSNQLFRNVMTPPTIYIIKDVNYINSVFNDPISQYTKMDASLFNLHVNCQVYYHEVKETDAEGNHYYRFMHFL